MEKLVHITATQKEIELWAAYSKISTPKLWKNEKFVGNGKYSFSLEVRIPDESDIKSGGKYSFRNFLKRTKDESFIIFINDFNAALEKYKNLKVC